MTLEPGKSFTPDAGGTVEHRNVPADARRSAAANLRMDPRAAVRRDRERLEKRETGHRSFWQSLGVLGMVGWPIALGAAGGTLLGHHLDQRFGSGLRWTLMLMTAGVLAGCFSAWTTLNRTHD